MDYWEKVKKLSEEFGNGIVMSIDSEETFFKFFPEIGYYKRCKEDGEIPCVSYGETGQQYCRKSWYKLNSPYSGYVFLSDDVLFQDEIEVTISEKDFESMFGDD